MEQPEVTSNNSYALAKEFFLQVSLTSQTDFRIKLSTEQTSFIKKFRALAVEEVESISLFLFKLFIESNMLHLLIEEMKK